MHVDSTALGLDRMTCKNERGGAGDRDYVSDRKAIKSYCMDEECLRCGCASELHK